VAQNSLLRREGVKGLRLVNECDELGVPHVDFIRRRKWVLLALLGVCVGMAVAWYHWWAAPGVTTVTGAIAYWMSYAAGLIFLLACLLTGAFFVGRVASRGIKRLLSR
jgi:hypothetical protein